MPNKNLKYKILIADEERMFVAALTYILENRDFEVITAFSRPSVFQQVKDQAPDLLILCQTLPDGKGVDICQRLRQDAIDAFAGAIIMIGMDDRKIQGKDGGAVYAFDAGADAYLLKPFGMRELIARVDALLRRGKPQSRVQEDRVNEKDYLEQGDLRLDVYERTVFLKRDDGCREINLSAIESALLEVLMSYQGKPVHSEVLYERVWGVGAAEQTTHNRKNLVQYIILLRRKIERDPIAPRYIRTVPMLGYKFCGWDEG